MTEEEVKKYIFDNLRISHFINSNDYSPNSIIILLTLNDKEVDRIEIEDYEIKNLINN